MDEEPDDSLVEPSMGCERLPPRFRKSLIEAVAGVL
jgi:hypothetical protein